MYARFAQEAKEEGFNDIAYLFEAVAKIEKEHETRYKKLLESVMSDKVFERENEIAWECSNCGHIHYGVKAPELCPVCSHPKAYFAQQSKNY